MQKRSVVIILLIVLSCAFVFVFNLTSIPIVSPLAQQIAAFPKSLIYGIRTNGDKNQDNKIKQENESLRKKLVDLERLKRDNVALRDQFETGLSAEYKFLPSRILGSRGGFAQPTELTIDQGKNAGIKKGMAVVVKDNLLGRVEEVTDNYSKVVLVKSKKFSTLARTVDTSALGAVHGQDDFVLFENVSINDQINSGQLLLTRGEINGEGYGIPPDFIIGKVTQVDRNESLPNQSAKVETSVDISRLNMVFVIIK